MSRIFNELLEALKNVQKKEDSHFTKIQTLLPERIHNTAWLTSAPLGNSCFSLNFVMLLQKANQNTLPPKILGTKRKLFMRYDVIFLHCAQ